MGEKIKEGEMPKALDAFFNAILASDKEKAEKYDDFIKKLITQYGNQVKNTEDFDILINYKITQILGFYVQKLLEDELSDKNRKSTYSLCFLYRQYRFMENNIVELIASKEGSPCSADKSRWILQCYKEFLINGKLPDMGIEESCYWKPKFGTAKQWMEFCTGLESLYHGKPGKYLISLKALF